ncbi:Tetratricopeptide repeat protein 14 [Perkinsus chesapeaki]|uniref:Tetratricopeptide repeat protein 14 n=1 Tax=Perkinsus chesapeaki TaxID=330153 RepID=A0A7J6LC32_PERCH|nr:Tetratricopeptide repeat protein 14 [Perkinsus chesapeaki]
MAHPSLDIDLLRGLAVTSSRNSDSTSSRDIWATDEALLAGTEVLDLNTAACAAARFYSDKVDYCECIYDQRFDRLRTAKVLSPPEFAKAWLREGPAVEVPGFGECYPVEPFEFELGEISRVRCCWCQKSILCLVPGSLLRDHVESNFCLPRESCSRTLKDLGVVAIEGYVGLRGWEESDCSVAVFEAIERAWPGDMSRGLIGRLEADQKWNDMSAYCVRSVQFRDDDSDPIAQLANRCFSGRRETAEQSERWASRRLREGLAKHKSGGDLEEALVYYDSALELDPNHADALVAKGAALTSQGKYNEAIKCFDRALRVRPDHANAAKYRDIAQRRMGAGRSSVSSSSRSKSVISISDDDEEERRRHKHHHHKKKKRR